MSASGADCTRSRRNRQQHKGPFHTVAPRYPHPPSPRSICAATGRLSLQAGTNLSEFVPPVHKELEREHDPAKSGGPIHGAPLAKCVRNEQETDGNDPEVEHVLDSR